MPEEEQSHINIANEVELTARYRELEREREGREMGDSGMHEVGTPPVHQPRSGEKRSTEREAKFSSCIDQRREEEEIQVEEDFEVQFEEEGETARESRKANLGFTPGKEVSMSEARYQAQEGEGLAMEGLWDDPEIVP